MCGDRNQHTSKPSLQSTCGRNGYITPSFLGADCLVTGGKNRHGWEMVKQKMLAMRPVRYHSILSCYKQSQGMYGM